jgi:CRISPR-associated protein Cmr3
VSQLVALDPFDTFIVRDGRPFNQDDEGAALAGSVFPPPPETIYGALRVCAARTLGWGGNRNWNTVAEWSPPEQTLHNAHIKVIGKSPVDHGDFRAIGPFVLGPGNALLFPAPLNLRRYNANPGCGDRLKKTGRVHGRIERASPSAPQFGTDLKGQPQFLVTNEAPFLETSADLAGQWVDAATLEFALGANGAKPGVPIARSKIVANEPRTGLARDLLTRTAVDGHLYRSARLRMKTGYRLTAILEGWNPRKEFTAFVPFGSENRPIFPPQFVTGVGLPRQPHVKFASNCYCAIFLTPLALPLSNGDLLEPGKPVEGLDGTLATAVCPRPILRGSFSRFGGRSVQSAALPAGTVLYMNGASLLEPGDAPKAAGVDTELGYGRYLVGRW